MEQDTFLSIARWDEMIRSAVMFSDVIWLHESLNIDYRIAPEMRNHINMTANELIDAKIIKHYALESDGAVACKNAEKVITQEEHLRLYDIIIKRVKGEKSFDPDNLADPERTSRIIEKRNELWKFGVASLLDSNISTACKSITKRDIERDIASRSIKTELTSKLFKMFSIGGLSHLTTSEIIQLQKQGKKFRNIVQELAVSAFTDAMGGNISVVAENAFDEQIKVINELLQATAGAKGIKKLLLTLVKNFAGLIPLTLPILIPTTALQCGDDLRCFFSDRKKYGFILFMNTLQTQTAGRT